MQEISSSKLEHNGNVFEIKTFQAPDGFKVIAFLRGTQVSPVYSVNYETNADYFMQHQQSLVAQLIGIACSDIQNGMYIK